MKRQTKIICTIGPASRSKDRLLKMARAGMDVARLNFSHGTHSEHQEVIETIRQINEEYSTGVRILQDLEGYRIRIGHLKKPILLEKGRSIWMKAGEEQTSATLPLEFSGDILAIRQGMCVFIDDGKIFLSVVRQSGKRIKMKVEQGGLLKSRKGVNIPEMRLAANILTDKDRRDIVFGVRHQVDFMAQSFVRNKRDIKRVAALARPKLPHCQIISKIENRQGAKNTPSILEACDGIMIARGDLGVSVPIYQIPLIQKDIIRRCNKRRKPVITATQMLESMTEVIRPTRAEVNDVANAILDGTDYVMLSGETAVGKFPVECVRMMCQIIDYTERSMYFL